MLTNRTLGIFIFIFLCNLKLLWGQTVKLSFEEMWSIARDRNIQIRNAGLLIEKSEAMKKTAWDFGPTELDLTRGQLNSDLVDNMYTVRQELGMPFTISATRKYYESERNFFRQNAVKISREIKKELRKYYYDWLYERELQRILDSSILIYQKSAEFANLQYETGESSLLAKVMLSSEVQKLILDRDLHTVRLRTIENQLQTILHSDSIFIPVDNKLTKLQLIMPGDSSSHSLDSVPEVMAQRSQIDVMNRYKRMMKSQISPSISAGYFNQELDQIPGFQGWRVGITFPLLFIPHKARSQAASIELSRAENQYTYEKLKAAQEISSLWNKYDQLKNSISYYESDRLQNADLIDQNANLLYQSGSIGYIEFVQNLTTSRQIRTDYVRLVHEYNQFVIDLYYYLDF